MFEPGLLLCPFWRKELPRPAAYFCRYGPHSERQKKGECHGARVVRDRPGELAGPLPVSVWLMGPANNCSEQHSTILLHILYRNYMELQNKHAKRDTANIRAHLSSVQRSMPRKTPSSPRHLPPWEVSTPTRMPSSISVAETFSPKPTTNLANSRILMTYLSV